MKTPNSSSQRTLNSAIRDCNICPNWLGVSCRRGDVGGRGGILRGASGRREGSAGGGGGWEEMGSGSGSLVGAVVSIGMTQERFSRHSCLT